MSTSASDDFMDYDVLAQLPKLLKDIKRNWPVLPSGLWNSSCIQAVFRLLHEVGIKSKSANLVNVYDLSQSIEKLISDIHEENEQPDVEEIEKLTQYLHQLSQAIEVSGPNQTYLSSDISSYEVLYLPRNKMAGDLICSAIEKNGWSVKLLSDIALLQNLQMLQQADVVLLDTVYLPQIESLKQAYSELKQQKTKLPELIFLAQHCDVEVRLEVLRAGATQCFSEPISVNDLMTSIKDIISPELKPHYRVLVVEDDESQARFACKLLNKKGFETQAITDPMNVMAAVEGFQPDLVLMDLYMPGANGIELTQLIRAKREARFIPIVFLSGEDDLEKKILALYSGADDYINKPVSPQHLVATVLTRIKRAQEMIDGNNLNMIDAVSGLANRRHLLDELDAASIQLTPESEHTALFVITLEGEEGTMEDELSPADNSLVSRVADVLGPVLGQRDLLARAGKRSFGVLLKRTLRQEIEQLGEDLFNQINSELSQGARSDPRWGIGLVEIESADVGAYHYLNQGEIISKVALEQDAERYLIHHEAANIQKVPRKISDDLLRDQVRTALKSGYIEFNERRYVALHEGGAIIEHVPSFSAATGIPSEIGDIYQCASRFDGLGILNRLVSQYAVRKLGEVAFSGNPEKVLVWMSGLAIHDEQLIPFIQSELRRLHVVGTGLIIEFDLPSLAPELKLAKKLLDELAGLGIAVLLANFACNDTAFKVLSYLRADAVRLHPSLMRKDDAEINRILTHIRALNALIILPRIEASERINFHWSEVADYVQAEQLNSIVRNPTVNSLHAVD